MIKYGIKLWTNNGYYFSEAAELHQDGLIDFIELYTVPGKISKKRLNLLNGIPVQIHAPHSLHGFNIFNLSKKKINLFHNETVKLANFFNSEFIILHAGIGNDSKIFKENITKIYDKRIIIENNPKIGLNNKICFGHSLSQLKFIKEKCKLNICLDIGHAIKSAISQKENYKKYLETLIRTLNPNYFHISDGLLHGEKDEHLNLGEGKFDLAWTKKYIFKQLLKNKNIYIVLEVSKNKDNLKNDIRNINFFKKINTK